MFVPQGFDEMKTIKTKLDELTGLGFKGLDITRPSSNVYFHDQNASAAAIIGIAANHNVANAVLQMHDVRLSTNKNINSYFTINGKSLKSLSNKHTEKELQRKLNNKKESFELGFISRRVSQILAASVDAVKDPVLESFNLNVNTINVGMMLLRLGYTLEEVGVFLNQPIIRNFSRYTALEQYPDKENIIQNLIDEYKGSDKTPQTGLDIKDLQKAIIANKNGYVTSIQYNDIQKEVGINFQRMLEAADEVSDLNSILKVDSLSSAPGPGIVDTVSKINKIRKVKENASTSQPLLEGVMNLFEVGNS